MKDEQKSTVNIAYIDAANLDKALKTYLKWDLDYGRFRIWLKDKYKVERAYIFIGLIPKYKNLYTYLSEAGFTLVFKEVVYQNGNTRPKGNCDTDLIMQATEDYYLGKLDQAILVSSDGDYASLVSKFYDNNKLKVIVSPSPPKKCSVLLKKTGAKIAYIDDQRAILEKNKKAPDGDRTP